MENINTNLIHSHFIDAFVNLILYTCGCLHLVYGNIFVLNIFFGYFSFYSVFIQFYYLHEINRILAPSVIMLKTACLCNNVCFMVGQKYRGFWVLHAW